MAKRFVFHKIAIPLGCLWYRIKRKHVLEKIAAAFYVVIGAELLVLLALIV